MAIPSHILAKFAAEALEKKPVVKSTTTQEALTLLGAYPLKDYVPYHQVAIMKKSLEAGDTTFMDTVFDLHKTITDMPEVYGQDGLGNKAVAHLHYFYSSGDWFITEKDTTDEQHQAYGIANLNHNGYDAGYIDIINMLGNPRIELDLHYTPQTLDLIKNPD